MPGYSDEDTGIGLRDSCMATGEPTVRLSARARRRRPPGAVPSFSPYASPRSSASRVA